MDTFIKIHTISTSKKKQYKIHNNTLFIGNDPIILSNNKELIEWDVSNLEDFNKISRDPNTNDIIIELNVFTDEETQKTKFSIIKTKGKLEKYNGFPVTIKDGEKVWIANIKDIEGMVW